MESLRNRPCARAFSAAAFCALLLQSAGCDVGRSILVPRSDASATDVPPTDVPPTDVPPTDVPATDVPPTDVPSTDVPPTDVPTDVVIVDGGIDVPAGDVPVGDVPVGDVPVGDVPAMATCSGVFAMSFPMCSGQPNFWSCITGLRAQLAGAELTLFSALTTCVERECGATPSEMCATSHCFDEVTACHPVCALAGSCAVATCTGMTCTSSFNRCGMPLSGMEATRFAAVRACYEQACGANLDPACVARPDTLVACAAQLTACGVPTPPTDGGVPTDLPVTTDAPTMCGAGLSSCGTECVNLQTSSAHCGVCNAACPAMTACMNGTCVGTGTCMAPLTQCGASCVDLQTNAAHCGMCDRACASGQACINGACVGTGNLRFTLTWDRPGDVDLHVTPPCGMNISYMRANMLICGGTLDRDDTRGTGPENVFFGATADRGEYLLCMIPFAISGSTTATLRIFEGTVLRQTFTRTYATSMATSECTRTSPFFVGTFTY